MTRVIMDGRSYPTYAPKYLWHRLAHWLAGPLRGCSCSGPGIGMDGKPLGRSSLLAADDGSCFHSRWRIEFPARDGYNDRRRLAKAECRITELELAVKRLEERLNHPVGLSTSGEVSVGGFTFPMEGLEINGRDWLKAGTSAADHEHDWTREGDHYKCVIPGCGHILRFIGGSLPEERL